MLLQLKRPLVFLDFETTGLDTETDRIVELAFVRLLPDGQRVSLVRPVNPGMAAMSKGAKKVTGLHTNDVCGLFGDNGNKPAQPLHKLFPELIEFLADSDLAGFNQIAYDVPLWLAECERLYKLEPYKSEPERPRFDMGRRLQIDVKLIFHACETSWDRFLMGPRNLSAAVRHYCGRELEGAHSAEADTQATIDVLLAQLQRHPELPRDVAGLSDFCARNRDKLREQPPPVRTNGAGA